MHLPTHDLEDFEDQSNAEGARHDVIICSFIFDEPSSSQYNVFILRIFQLLFQPRNLCSIFNALPI